MNGLAQTSLLPLLKIAIVPVMLLSVLWRNRRDKRRRAEAEASVASDSKPSRREVIDPATLDPEALRAALDRLQGGTGFVTARGEAIPEQRLRKDLADRLMDAAQFDAADLVLTEARDRDAGLILCQARLCVHRGRIDEARTALSDAADLQLSALRQAARGMRVHLAEMLAEGMPEAEAPSLADADLTGFGPLPCLHLAGRSDEARALAAELLEVLDRALAIPIKDADGRIDGLPVATVQAIRDTLSAVPDWTAA